MSPDEDETRFTRLSINPSSVDPLLVTQPLIASLNFCLTRTAHSATAPFLDLISSRRNESALKSGPKQTRSNRCNEKNFQLACRLLTIALHLSAVCHSRLQNRHSRAPRRTQGPTDLARASRASLSSPSQSLRQLSEVQNEGRLQIRQLRLTERLMEGGDRKSSSVAKSAKSPRVQRFFELVTLCQGTLKVNRK
jgi:hypothetical protein